LRRTVRFVGTVVGRLHGAGADLMGAHLSRMHRVDEVVVVVLVGHRLPHEQIHHGHDEGEKNDLVHGWGFRLFLLSTTDKK
jgi:hypothetical protein